MIDFLLRFRCLVLIYCFCVDFWTGLYWMVTYQRNREKWMESIASSMCNSIKFPRFSLIFSISQDFCVWYLFEFTVPFFRFTFIEQNFRFGFLFFFVSFKAMQLRIMSDCLVVTYQQDQEKRGSLIHFAVSWISQSRSEPIHF